MSFHLQPEVCAHSTASWGIHHAYGSLVDQVTCLACGTPMVVYFAKEYPDQMQRWFEELDKRRINAERAA